MARGKMRPAHIHTAPAGLKDSAKERASTARKSPARPRRRQEQPLSTTCSLPGCMPRLAPGRARACTCLPRKALQRGWQRVIKARPPCSATLQQPSSAGTQSIHSNPRN